MSEQRPLIEYPKQDTMFQQLADHMVRAAAPLRDTDWVVDLALTGSAGLLRLALWAAPGASNNLLGERWTYAQENTDALLGRSPPQGKYSRLSSALSMSAATYARAKQVGFERGLGERPVMGVAMTAAVATSRKRRGEDSCRVAVRTAQGFYFVDAQLQKAHERGQERGERRLEEGLLCDLLTLMTVLHVAGLPVPTLSPDWGLVSEQLILDATGALVLRPSFEDASPLAELPQPFNQALMPDQRIVPLQDLDPDAFILFPGSFDPLHHGHHKIAAMAKEQTGKDVLFQITAHHPKKGTIPHEALIRRAAQLQFQWPVVIFDQEGLYAQKAALVPGMTMLIGADVVYGLQDLRYYGDDKVRRRKMFEQLAQLGTRFLVAGREVNGFYETLGDVPIAQNFAHLFHPLGGRLDVSSSELRKERG
jgi:cytidyltransferase-like protein